MKKKTLCKRLMCCTLAAVLSFTSVSFDNISRVHAEEGAPGFKLVYCEDDTGTLVPGESERVYLEGAEDYAIAGVTYSVNNDKVEVDKYGNLSIKEGVTLTGNETVTVTADVTYYDKEDVVFADNFEGDVQKFETNADRYQHSATRSLYGRKAATPATTKGTATKTFDEALTDVTVTMWFYDANAPVIKRDKFLVRINGTDANTEYSQLGVMYTNESSYVDGLHKTNYACMIPDVSYAKYSYGATTNVQRSADWHKFEWIIDSQNGLTIEIDDTVVETHDNVSTTAANNTGRITVKDYPNITQLTGIAISNGWVNQSGVAGAIVDKMFVDGVSVVKNSAEIKTVEIKSVEIPLHKHTEEIIPAVEPTYEQVGKTEGKKCTDCGEILVAQQDIPALIKTELKLIYGKDGSEALTKDTNGRIFLEGAENLAIADITYSVNNEKVAVDEFGNLSIKDPAVPLEMDETVEVTAQVTYYDQSAVLFADSFEEDEKKFAVNSDAYKHSDALSLYGRKAAAGNSKLTAREEFENVTDVTVTMWIYDPMLPSSPGSQRFMVSVNGNAYLGFMYVGESSYVDNLHITNYACTLPGLSYARYCYGATTNVARESGKWHKFEWIIDSEKGLTIEIDDTVVETHKGVVNTAGANTETIRVEGYENVKSLASIGIHNGWGSSAGFYVDGVSVVKNGATTSSQTVTSGPIKLDNLSAYDVFPADFEVYSNYPEEKTLFISPNLQDYGLTVQKVLVDGEELTGEQWAVGSYIPPEYEVDYPDDFQIILNAEVFRNLTTGEHKLTIVDNNGKKAEVSFRAKMHERRDYYLSNITGDDNNDGLTPETAWKTFDKLESVTFGPDDHIYLDAESVWSGVQFTPKGSGVEGYPIVLDKYNDGGDSSKRPILNGDGTVADLEANPYRDTGVNFPSGVIELITVDQWEIHSVEITNYEQELTKGAVGRCGIFVRYYLTEALGKKDLTSEEMVEVGYKLGKSVAHIVVEDCYVHDVVSFHRQNAPTGGGVKGSCGISVGSINYDVHIENNIVMYAGLEGIRSNGYTHSEEVHVSNNFIVGVPGDGIVVSGGYAPMVENNYLTDGGYSYSLKESGKNWTCEWSASDPSSYKNLTEKTGAQAQPMGDRQNPIVFPSTPYAGIWCIGTRDTLFQYNEVVNNVWVSSDGQAFDADSNCIGTVFQYNYTYRNPGGVLLTCDCDEGTVYRYNVSVDDLDELFLSTVNGIAPAVVHNNLFVLSDRLARINKDPYDGGFYFYNNIVIAPNGVRDDFVFDRYGLPVGSEIKNNLFYPSAILDSVNKNTSATIENNVALTGEQLASVFVDLEGFLEAQPVKALLGRGDLKEVGVKVENLVDGKGNGYAAGQEAGRYITAPTGGFDMTQFMGIHLAENSPAIDKGISVAEMHDYGHKAMTMQIHPLMEDFFGHDISTYSVAGNARATDTSTTVDIGPYQTALCKFDQKNTAEKYLKSEATCEEATVYYYSCKCGETGTTTFTEGEALGHSWEKNTAEKYLKSEATCEEATVYYYSCKCGETGTTTFTEGEALGHSWDTGTVTTPATTDKEGVRTYTCTICMGTKTEAIDKLAPEFAETEDPDDNKTGTVTTDESETNGADAASTDETASPKTGDTNSILLWIVMLLLSCGAFAAVIVSRKKIGEK